MNNDNLKEHISEYERKIDGYEKQIAELQQQYAKALAIIQQKDEYMMQSQQLCKYYATGKLAGLNHFLFRIKGQLLKGSKNDKEAFWKWFVGRIKKTNRSLGDGAVYNPWMVVSERLGEAMACRISNANFADIMKISCDNADEEHKLVPLISDETKRILKADYIKYDVIILSVIDYNLQHVLLLTVIEFIISMLIL